MFLVVEFGYIWVSGWIVLLGRGECEEKYVWGNDDDIYWMFVDYLLLYLGRTNYEHIISTNTTDRILAGTIGAATTFC